MARDGLEVTARRPKDSASSWRWFFCMKLIKLAAWVYPFQLRFYRELEPHDEVEKH